MKINTLKRHSAPIIPGILTSLLLAAVLAIPPGQARAFPAESVDPAIHLPPNQAVQVTTEFLARVVFDRIAARIARGELGPDGAGLESLRVVLHESHVAWAGYEGRLARG